MTEHYPIKLEWYCSCRDGKCVYEGADNHRCVSMTCDEEAYMCPYLEAVRVE